MADRLRIIAAWPFLQVQLAAFVARLQMAVGWACLERRWLRSAVDRRGRAHQSRVEGGPPPEPVLTATLLLVLCHGLHCRSMIEPSQFVRRRAHKVSSGLHC